MTILFCGDPHGRFDHILEAASLHNPTAVVLLGDLQPARPLHVELAPIREKVWFIHGNHDTDSEGDYGNVFESELAERNLHGRVATLPDGTRIAGLGGIFRSDVWMPPAAAHFQSQAEHAQARLTNWTLRSGSERRFRSTIYPETIRDLLSMEADVLITHEAPTCHPYGKRVIDDLARTMRVRSAFHGHHHDRLDYSKKWGSMGCRWFGVGLAGIVDQDGSPIVLGELDFVRRFRPRLNEEEDAE